MEGKKISFGFFKTKKADKPLIVSNDEEKQYIECVEEKSIKVVGGEEVKTNAPLVIPLKPNTLITADRLKEIAEKVESALEEPEIKQEPMLDANVQDPLAENETLDQMAVRELMQQAKNEVKTDASNLAIPAPAKTVPEGQKESTLDEYEAVPIQEFGMAMLRGMGWTPSKDGTKYKQPELRPKGLGLGADNVIKENKKKQAAKDSKAEELVIVKNSFVKITAGKYSGYYGKVVSLDEDNGRVMVDITVKKETVSLSEFMMLAVTKSEYDKESKVINADSYEEYKKEEVSHKSLRREENSSSSQRRDEKEKDRKERYRETVTQRDTENNDYRRQRDNDSANGKSRSRQKRDSSSSDERSSRKKKKERRRHSSSDSLSELSEDDTKHKHSKHKSRRRKSRSISGSRKRSATPEGKRDIDKKRKGKKKKRDRDRSPNYKKHRK